MIACTVCMIFSVDVGLSIFWFIKHLRLTAGFHLAVFTRLTTFLGFWLKDKKSIYGDAQHSPMLQKRSFAHCVKGNKLKTGFSSYKIWQNPPDLVWYANPLGINSVLFNIYNYWTLLWALPKAAYSWKTQILKINGKKGIRPYHWH